MCTAERVLASLLLPSIILLVISFALSLQALDVGKLSVHVYICVCMCCSSVHTSV